MKTKKPSKLKDPALPFAVFDFARQGMTDGEIARLTGVSAPTLRRLKAGDGPVARALKVGRAGGVGQATKTTERFSDFVYRRLPPHLRKVWDKIDPAANPEDVLGEEDLRDLMLEGGPDAKKHLFLHAMVACNFNASEACRKVGVSLSAFADWRVKDPAFAELLNEVNEHKKNFFESKLIQKVDEGDTAAVIFVNRTANRDRGYGEKLTIDHAHTHSMVTLDRVLELLDVDTKRKVLDAVERASKPALPAKSEVVEDAEIVSVKEELK
jgi:hypothetical protein